MAHKKTGLDPESVGSIVEKTASVNDMMREARNLAIDRVEANPDQPRKTFDPKAFDELRDSIKELGVMVPLLVRPNGEGFQIICGERRYRAAKELGLKELPVVIRKADDITALRMAYDENLKREDLTLLDEATFLQGLIDKDLVKNRQALAESMGVSEGRISQKLKILKLPEKIREGFKIHPFLGELHVRSLAKVSDQGLQERLFGSMLRRELSGHQAEHLVEKAIEDKPKKKKRKARSVSFEDVKVTREGTGYLLHLPGLSAEKLADLLERVVQALRQKGFQLPASAGKAESVEKSSDS